MEAEHKILQLREIGTGRAKRAEISGTEAASGHRPGLTCHLVSFRPCLLSLRF